MKGDTSSRRLDTRKRPRQLADPPALQSPHRRFCPGVCREITGADPHHALNGGSVNHVRLSAAVLPFIALLAAGFGLVTTAVPALAQLFGVPVICGPFDGCQRILDHPMSRLAGVPVALCGALLFVAALALLPQSGRSLAARRALLGLGLAGSAASGLLQVRIYRELELVCPWCVGAAFSLAVLAGLAWLLHARPASRPRITGLAVGVTVAVAALFITSEWLMMLGQRNG